jgi:DNA-binding beta-propeller fold protein YncE
MAMYATGDHVYVWTEDRHGLNDLTAGVKIFNADTGEVLGFVGFDNAPAFLRQPILTAGHGRLYLDIDDLDGHLEVIDTAAFDVVARIRIDTSPEGDLRDIPVSAALSPNGRHLYVANQGVRLSSDEATEVGWVSIIDTETNNVISEIALTQPGISESYCPNPEFVAIGRGGNRLLVACQNGIALIIDIESKTVVDVVTLRHPTQVVAANLLRNTVYIGTTGEAGLTVIPL